MFMRLAESLGEAKPDSNPNFEYPSAKGIEYGFSMVRATGDGFSATFDYQEHVLSTADSFTTDKAMVSHLPSQGVKTIYTMIGDLFAWLSIASFVGLLGLAQFRKK